MDGEFGANENYEIMNWWRKMSWWMWMKVIMARLERCWRQKFIIDIIVVAAAEYSRWSATSRSRTDAETSADRRRQCQERVRHLLVRLAHVSTDDTASC